MLDTDEHLHNKFYVKDNIFNTNLNKKTHFSNFQNKHNDIIENNIKLNCKNKVLYIIL